MKMSTKGRYSLRLMIELARRYGEGPVMVDDIADAQSLSSGYIHILAGNLKVSGLVRSTRGPRGGYELARPPENVTALEVIRTAEGSGLIDCLPNPSCCERAVRCAARDLWLEVNAAMENVLSALTIKELAQRQDAHERK